MVKMLNPYRMRLKLLEIKGALDCVPTDIAPDKDKGIYFYKAVEDLKELIKVVITATYLEEVD